MKENEISQAIRQYKTPFYIFDTDILIDQIKKLRAALGTNVELCYAMKANPFIIGALTDSVDYFEVCSPGEFHICERAKIPADKVVMSGVYKNPKDIEYSLNNYGGEITYTIESLSQWQYIKNYAEEHELPIRVLLRLTTGNQFGMDENAIRQIVGERNCSPHVSIEGIQYFAGTQKKATGKFENELTMLDKLCAELKQTYDFTVKKLEYGPGLPIYYFEDDINEEELLLDALSQQIKKLKFGGKVTLEMGRFIAAPCGIYVTSVVDMKINKNKNYCIVDGGIHHINYFGQMMAMKKPPILHWNEGNGEPVEWTVCGSLCTMNDVLIKQCPFSDLHLGDKLVFGKVGAYSVTEGISLFLSRELPQVVLYSKESDFQLARSNYPTDILNYFQK